MRIIGTVVIALAVVWLAGTVLAFLTGYLALIGVLLNVLIGWGLYALGAVIRKSRGTGDNI